MGLQITTNQIQTMAPDASSASAGKKLSNTKNWKSLGQNSEALWGECQGSALYQVRVYLPTMSIQCSCPSRKQPCKHGLGLLFLTAGSPAAVAESEAPEWVVSWLAKRAATTKRKETIQSKSDTPATPSAAQLKTAEKRKAQVAKGLEQLDLWLNDLIRNGLGSVETRPATFWENQAKKMVDAQAPALATRLRLMAGIPNASPDWPARLLAQCGQLALLTEAYQRLEQLDPALQEDVRLLVGWSLREDDVMARGERVEDDWLFLGQTVEEGERGKIQRTWLLGTTTGRTAMILQFSIAGTPFQEVYPVGSQQRATLVYWPGAAPQRALVQTRQGVLSDIQHFPAQSTIAEFLSVEAATLARLPWQERFLCTMRATTPLCDKQTGRWWLRDSEGKGLPLSPGDHWHLLALTGGHEVNFTGEWNGETLRPLGVQIENTYHLVRRFNG